MIYTLENSTTKITASTHGGELHNLIQKEDGTEYLWNGDSKYWKYHAPLLFPIVGKVKDGKYLSCNKTFELPQHGLARVSEFNMIEQTLDSITFSLKYSDETLKIYPYKFDLRVKYTLISNGVTVEYKVINLDTQTIFFSIGAHPAFMCPLKEDETIADYYFELNKKENSSIMTLDENGYFSHNRVPYLNNSNVISLNQDTFKNDALIFDDLKSNLITLKSKNHNKELSMDFTNFPYMALWSKPTGAPFVCIEPWYGHSDYCDFNGEFKDKEGIQKLDISKEFSCSYTVSFK